MAFHFGLEPVLRLRASYERLERLRLLALAAMAVRVREEIAAVERDNAAARAMRQQAMREGATAAEIQWDMAKEGARGRRRAELAEKLVAIERVQQKQRRAYETARQKREILENLRERQRNEYQREQERREQMRVDEMYLLRRGRESE